MGERKRRGSRRRVVLALVVAGAVLVALFVVARARRAPARAAEGSRASPAGGAASVRATPHVDAAPDDLVEDGQRHDVRSFSFALADHELAIEDVGMARTLDAVLEKRSAAFVVNAGFFDPEGKPLGLAISGGAVLSRLARAASGGVLTWDGTRAALWETESFQLPEGTRFAVQCRPRLVVAGTPNVKRDDGKRSERTALCLRDGGRTLEVVVARAAEEGAGEAPGPSLYALAQHLAARGCEDALNLDGGPSTGFAMRIEDGGVARELPRGPVRHAIVIRKR